MMTLQGQKLYEVINYCRPKIGDFPNTANDGTCVLHELPNRILYLDSHLTTHSLTSVPNSQGWSRCQYCVGDGPNIYVSNRSSRNSPVVVKIFLSWSLWGEFFHSSRNDQYMAKFTVDIKLKNMINVPVFFIPVLTFHIGHLLIDVLEQTYHTMTKFYDKVQYNSLIVIDVAGLEERNILKDKLFYNIYNQEYDTYGQILQSLSHLPIMSADQFFSLSKDGVIFKDLHIGLDISHSFFNLGYKTHPSIFKTYRSSTSTDHSLQEVSRRYKDFQSHIMSFVQSLLTNKTTSSSSYQHNISQNQDTNNNTIIPTNIIFVQRTSNRMMLNLHDLVSNITHNSFFNIDTIQDISIVDLSVLPFTQQLQLLGSTRILIAMAGTALHNLLFMKPGTAAIIIMQPEWCPWAWMYANQAALLGIHVYVLCTDHCDSSNIPSYVSRPSYHWTREFWKQGPRITKAGNVTVPTDRFVSLFQQALKRIQNRNFHQDNQNIHSNDVEVVIDDNCDSILEDISQGENRTNRNNNNDNTLSALPIVPPSIMNISNHENTPNENILIFGTHNSSRQIRDYVPVTPYSHKYSQSPSHIVSADNVCFVYLADVNILEGNPTVGWRISILGEIVTLSSIDTNILYSSLLYLTICFQTVAEASSRPWCYQIRKFNYYSDIFLTVTNPVISLHMWAQISTYGGHIHGSDSYVVLDLRIPNGGIPLYSSNHLLSQLFSLLPRLKLLPDSVTYTLPVATRYSYNYEISAMCERYNMSAPSCCDLFSQLNSWLYKLQLIETLSLPTIQIMPTPSQPFVFLHIEKTAGTSLRE